MASVIIGDGVISIADEAFSGCSSLTSVTVGSSVTNIVEAFYDSPISEFHCYAANPPELVYSPYAPFNPDKTKDKATLYVPIGSKTAYEDSKWSTYFKNIVEMN